MNVTLRSIEPSDIETCGAVIYKAFAAFAAQTGFPPSFPSIEAATAIARSLTEDHTVFGVAAEQNGRLIGSNFLTMGDRICGVGPVTVLPTAQGSGIGRQLMEAILERGKAAKGIRLVQDSANILTVSLYATLGFEVKEPLVVTAGTPREEPPPSWQVRPLEHRDITECNELCEQIHGFDRASEIEKAREPFVAVHGGRIAGYLTSATFWQTSHGVAKSEQDMKALLAGASAITGKPVALLLPTRQAALFRWCLDNGFRVQRPMTLMAMGAYQEPAGAWFPSVWY